jgi:hypothetical protein
MSFKSILTFEKIKGLVGWAARDFQYPCPDFIKRAHLVSCGNRSATWVETGTFLGGTTRVLAEYGKKVYSLEPEPTLYANAKKQFEFFNNVEILNGPSEVIFPKLLPTIGEDVNFWLDGHFSAGQTYKGENDTPIMEELACISQNLHRYGKVVILIDDIRLFTGDTHVYGAYPSANILVDWARQNKMRWFISHDIFCAKN